MKIHQQFDAVRLIHRQDLDQGIADAFMFDSIEKNTRMPVGNFIGNGFFLQRISPGFPMRENIDAPTCMIAMSKKQSNPL